MDISNCFRGDGTFPLSWKSDILSSGEGTLYYLGNGKFYPLGTILFSGNRTTRPQGIGPRILWDSGHPLGSGTWERDHAILWDSDHLLSGKYPLGKHYLGNGF